MQTSQLEPLNGRSRLRFIGLTLLIALPVTAVFTYPLIFQLQTGIAGYFGADALNHAWSTWWYKNALVNLGQSPAEISYIYYPNLIYHPNVVAAPWAKLVAYPFLQFLDPIPLYNLHLFLAFVLIWVLMALLCLELTQNPVAALIGGAIFTFAANRTMHAIAGHFTQSLIYTYPMLVLALWIAWKRPSIGKGFFLAFALILSAIVDLMPLAFFAIPVTAVLLIHFLQTDKRSFFSRKRMITFGIGFGMAGIVLLWVMWPLLSNVANGGLDWYQADGVGEFSADLLALFIPPPNHLLSQTWPALHRFSETVYPFGQSENIIYTGIIVLLLAVLGIKAEWKSRADVRLWVTVAIIASVFALGPLLRVVGKFISIGETPVIMPYAILMQLPFLSWGRTPARFHLTALFAISILAAFGMRWLLHKTKHQQWRKLLPVILLALILLDAAIVYPWPMADITVPDFYQTVAADERAVAVLDIPATDYVAAKYHMLYQMTHQHALVGGYRTRLPIAARESMDQLTADATSPEGDPSRLAEAGVGYVVLHRQFLEADELDEMASYMLTNFGSPAYEDELIVAFLIPEPNEVAPMPLESLR